MVNEELPEGERRVGGPGLQPHKFFSLQVGASAASRGKLMRVAAGCCGAVAVSLAQPRQQARVTGGIDSLAPARSAFGLMRPANSFRCSPSASSAFQKR